MLEVILIYSRYKLASLLTTFIGLPLTHHPWNLIGPRPTLSKKNIKKFIKKFFTAWKKSDGEKKSEKKVQKKARGGVRVLHQPLKSTNFGFFRVFLRTLSGNLGQKSRAPPTPSIVFERCFHFRGGGIFPQGALSGAPGGVGGLGFYPSKRGAARGFLTIFRAGTMASGEHLDDRP